jgi:hypothetical protein
LSSLLGGGDRLGLGADFPSLDLGRDRSSPFLRSAAAGATGSSSSQTEKSS